MPAHRVALDAALHAQKARFGGTVGRRHQIVIQIVDDVGRNLALLDLVVFAARSQPTQASTAPRCLGRRRGRQQILRQPRPRRPRPLGSRPRRGSTQIRLQGRQIQPQPAVRGERRNRIGQGERIPPGAPLQIGVHRVQRSRGKQTVRNRHHGDVHPADRDRRGRIGTQTAHGIGNRRRPCGRRRRLLPRQRQPRTQQGQLPCVGRPTQRNGLSPPAEVLPGARFAQAESITIGRRFILDQCDVGSCTLDQSATIARQHHRN